MTFRRRLATLERKIPSDAIELLMPGGEIATLRGYAGGRLLDLYCRAMSEVDSGVKMSPEVALIRQSIAGTEKGGHMIELIRALLGAPMFDRGT